MNVQTVAIILSSFRATSRERHSEQCKRGDVYTFRTIHATIWIMTAELIIKVITDDLRRLKYSMCGEVNEEIPKDMHIPLGICVTATYQMILIFIMA